MTTGDDAAIIELTGVAKSFGSVDAVAPFDLRVGSGEFLGIVGPSGCGKSTLLRMIAGLETPSAGTVSVCGADPARARRAKQIAVVPQSPGLLPWRTVEANASLLLDVRRRANPATHPAAAELLDEVGLGAFRRAYPHQLSGGMQQRVALVRAFALGAPVVLMDEPFAALDEITRAEMRALLARMVERRTTTVVFVTHSIAEAVFLSDRVLVCTPRPAAVAAQVAVELPRPRTAALEDDLRYVDLCARARHALHEAMAR